MQLRVPKGARIPEDREGKWYLTDDGALVEKRLLPLGYLPDSGQSAVRQIHQEVAAAIRRAVKLLRWRWSLSGPYNPFSSWKSSYSFDGNVWHALPDSFSLSVIDMSAFRLIEKRIELFAELLSSGDEEPPRLVG